MAFDAIILGGGIIGSFAAYHLSSRGVSVALVDDGRGGATAAAAGMLSPSFEIAHEQPEASYAQVLRDALGLWDEAAAALADDPLTAFGYRRDGVYGAGFSAPPAGCEPLDADHRFGRFLEAPSVWAEAEGSVEPLLLRKVLRQHAERSGARLITGHAVRGEGPSVSVAGETLTADTLIVTAGSHSDPSVTPVRGQAVLMQLDPQDEGAVPAVVRSSKVYFCPRRDNLVYIGATEEWPEDQVADPLPPVLNEALRLLPCLERARIVERFDGLRPFIGRSGPRIDWADQGVLVAFGHHRNGVLLSPWTARRIGDLLGL
ncbi:MAG: FAD-dependent oxidoreductase [Pseudomonadota bacterium]